jgi:ribulose-phosphate 3-epimerase
MTIYPSILTDSLSTAQAQLERVAEFVDTVQIDIVDGEFADNITFSPIDLLELQTLGVQFDIHLMTIDPINDVVECAELRNMRAILGQIERMSSQAAFLEHVKSLKVKAGLSLDLHTPISAIDEEALLQIDAVQLMSIQAGFQGQEFQQSVVEKMQELFELRRSTKATFEIIVDGGVRPQTLPLIKTADSVTVGSFLWKSSNIKDALKELQNSANSV